MTLNLSSHLGKQEKVGVGLCTVALRWSVFKKNNGTKTPASCHFEPQEHIGFFEISFF
jgi:hypothetical protein